MTLILVFSFILLATISCSVLIMARNINPIFKATLILATIWWGIAVYFMPGYLAGYSKSVDKLPDKAWVLSYKIVEPSPTHGIKGGMYFWVIENPEKELEVNRLNPVTAFKKLLAKEPRAYVVPYDRELHKRLVKAGKAKKKGGMLIYKQGNGKKGGKKGNSDAERDQKDVGQFEITNPVQLLPPKD